MFQIIRDGAARWSLTLMLAVLLSTPAHGTDSDAEPSFANHIRLQLQRLGHMQTAQAAGSTLRETAALTSAYHQREHAPIWTSESGWHPNAHMLVEYLSRLPQHGISGNRYHLDSLRDLRDGRSLAERIHADLLLSDAYVSLLRDFQRQPEASEDDATALRIITLLLRLKPQEDPAVSLDAALPSDAQYWALSRALRRLLQQREDDQNLAPVEDPIKPGDVHPAVFRMSQRLQQTGDYAGPPSELYSAAIETALRQFQRRHGLDDDGIVGPATREQLNASTDSRIRQLIVNLERRRHSSIPLQSSHIRVNLAAQQLHYVHEGQPVLDMKVIVGRTERPTPLTRSAINEVVLNPDWTVPYRIAVDDKLPLIQQDPNYLPTNGFTVYEGWSRDAPTLDPASIDWQQLSRNNFPYVLRQQPGAGNALGRVKFLFPNPYSVYLHDTPNHSLFDRGQRLFSSGCVRLSQPMVLAEVLLRNHGRADAWRAVGNAEDTMSLPLVDRVPVHLEYWTAWVDGSGDLQFRPDVYGHDETTLAALTEQGQLAAPEILVAELERDRELRLAQVAMDAAY